MAEFQIHGLDEALRKMRGLAPALLKKALRSAGTKAMRPVRDAARAKAKTLDDPETASNIAKAIVTRYDGRASKREGGSVTKVGVVGGARALKGTQDPGHWRFLEFGTENMAAQPFMRPALESNVSLVTDTFVSALAPEIDKALARIR